MTNFKNIPINKTIITFLVLTITVSFLFVGFNYYEQHSLKKIDVSSSILDTNKSILFSIDGIEKKAKQIIISGWAANKDYTPRRIKIAVLIKEKKSEVFYSINTDMKIREDIINNFNNNSDYKKSGFIASLRNNKLKKNTIYEVYILYRNDGENILLPTDKIIEN